MTPLVLSSTCVFLRLPARLPPLPKAELRPHLISSLNQHFVSFYDHVAEWPGFLELAAISQLIGSVRVQTRNTLV